MASAYGSPERIDGGGPDMVRRLLARTARARTHAEGARVARPFPEENEDEDEGEFARLETEIMVLKAALRAERQEVEALRAEVQQLASQGTPVTDIRCDRDRWANLVERLLFVER